MNNRPLRATDIALPLNPNGGHTEMKGDVGVVRAFQIIMGFARLWANRMNSTGLNSAQRELETSGSGCLKF